MSGKLLGKIWKILPASARLKVVRLTQAKYTASVAVIVTNRAGKVLLLEHFLRPSAHWGIPGGFLNHGEQPEDAARREIREETGLELENLRLLRVRTLYRHIEFLFRAEASGNGRVSSSEIKDLGWFAAGEMPSDMLSSQKATIEKVLRGEI